MTVDSLVHTYKFNTRDLVQVTRSAPPKLAHLVGLCGIILYHSDYQDGIPTSEAVMIGWRIVKTKNYQKTGRIDETIGGQIHTLPISCLEKVTALGAELDTDSLLE